MNKPAKTKSFGSVHTLFAQTGSSASERQPLIGGQPRTPVPPLGAQLSNIFLSSWLNVLLIAVPVSFVSYYGEWSPGATFALSFFSLVPLAAQLGNFTEDLALRSNEAIGALLNATFGNATELIISVFALKNGMNTVIQNSLIGSILGNMLLVLGCSLLGAGIMSHTVEFSGKSADVYCSMLLLAAAGLLIPTMYSSLPGSSHESTLTLSRHIAICMCVSYVLYLIFQLYTHKQMFEEDDDAEKGGAKDEEPEEPEEPQFSAALAVIALATTTILISFESEFLVDSLEPAAAAWGLTQAFIGIILLPIVGNAAEHATAVTMAMRQKMDIALGVAVGSSLQIALLVIPLLVVISWITGHDLDLNFQPFNVVITFVSVVITNVLVYDGRSHWLEGVLLLMLYIMVALSYLHTSDVPMALSPHGTAAPPVHHK